LLAPLPTYLGALGITGLTAYFGVLDVGRIRAGDTVVMSGAAGAVGSIAGQISKIKGCRAIGVAGGPEKCRWISEDLGFDAAIDYKSQDVERALREHAPDGVDVFFDNVGGEILDTVLTQLARGARIVLSGGVSQYTPDQVRGPSNYLSLIGARASMIGFLTPDYAERYPQARAELAKWLREGRLISREDVLEGGVPAFPNALPKLFAGENIGKLLLAVP
jgi:NADPH-dependent curcumin reductase CurA